MATAHPARLETGLLSLGDLLPDPETGVMRSEAERHRTLIEQAVLAERVGFDSIHLGEHHGSSYQLSAPAVVLAAIGERTEHLTLSTGVTLLANLDPFRVAEDYATVDALSGGRAEIVAGRGSLFARTFEIFGQDPADSHALFEEHTMLLLRLLREERVEHDGPFRPLHGETSRPRPTGPLPVWIGAGSSTRSIDLAAALGCPLMLPSVFAPAQAFLPAVRRYREQWQRAGHAGDPRIGACCHCHVAATTELARARFLGWYHNYWRWVQALVQDYTPQAPVLDFDFEARASGPAVIGSSSAVVERIATFTSLLDLDRMIFMFDLGGIPDAVLFDSIEQFGAEVLPELR